MGSGTRNDGGAPQCWCKDDPRKSDFATVLAEADPLGILILVIFVVALAGTALLGLLT